MRGEKICSFFGHREIKGGEELKAKVSEVVEDLIVNYGVLTFLFGRQSEFDSLCHLVVTELKEKYPDIKRVAYTCKNETYVLESERLKWEKMYSHILKKDVYLLGVEEEFEHKAKYVAGKASYVERNKAMIDNSDFCVFYYDENYEPKLKKFSKSKLCYYQPKSGTKIAYDYAKRKMKTIIKIFIINIKYIFINKITN